MDQEPGHYPETAPPLADWLDRGAFWLLLAFVAIAPFVYTFPAKVPGWLPESALNPRGDMILELFAFLIAAATAFSRSPGRPWRSLRVPLAAAAALVLLGLLQLVPLPERLLRQAAPENAQIYHDSAALLGEGIAAWRISLAPQETLRTALLLLAYVALFLASANLLRTRLRRRLFAAALMGTALAQIGLAIGPTPWYRRLSGLFENPNHFAGYLELALAVAFGVLWAEVLINPERAPYADASERLRMRAPPLLIRLFLWGCIGVGIALTQSRGAILASAVSMATLLFMATVHRRGRARRGAALKIGIAVAVGILLVSVTAGRSPLARLLQSRPSAIQNELRLPIWETSLDAWKQFPLLGSGLGTFREAFRHVQPREIPILVEYAHNEFLQLLVTGGSIGAALGVLLFASLFVQLLRVWHKQRHREESAFVLSGIGALLSVTLHGLVEFNLSIPVIPATLACVLGAAWSAGADR